MGAVGAELALDREARGTEGALNRLAGARLGLSHPTAYCLYHGRYYSLFSIIIHSNKHGQGWSRVDSLCLKTFARALCSSSLLIRGRLSILTFCFGFFSVISEFFFILGLRRLAIAEDYDDVRPRSSPNGESLNFLRLAGPSRSPNPTDNGPRKSTLCQEEGRGSREGPQRRRRQAP